MKFGQDFDIVPAHIPADVDSEAGFGWGFRVRMTNYGGVDVVGFFGASPGGTNIGVTVEQFNDPVAGSSLALPVVDRYYWKGGTVLEADTPWDSATQEANEEWGEASWDSAGVDLKVMTFASVQSEDMDDGFEWMAAKIDTTGGETNAALFYILYGLQIQRDPVDLPITLGT